MEESDISDMESPDSADAIDPALMDFRWKCQHFEGLNLDYTTINNFEKLTVKCRGVVPALRNNSPEVSISPTSSTISTLSTTSTSSSSTSTSLTTSSTISTLSTTSTSLTTSTSTSTSSLQPKVEEIRSSSLYNTIYVGEVVVSNYDDDGMTTLDIVDNKINVDIDNGYLNEGLPFKEEGVGFEPDKTRTSRCPSEKEMEAMEVELRDNSSKATQPILDELITSEQSYISSLLSGIRNYGNIFERSDLPLGLRGKKYVLLGNIEQIAEFHRDEFLPMLIRNRLNLRCLFKEFQQFIEKNYFYGYVIFTMNKQRSLKICEQYKNYFKTLQLQLNDKLGINSFLVQPIQRIAKYPLMLKEFLSALFENGKNAMKSTVESCCHLDKKLRTLLTTTNESEVVNDVVDCHEFNIFHQGKFRKVCEFSVFDHTLKRSYRGKVFFFEKCIIYTEIKGKKLIFHGRYPYEHIGIVPNTKSFTLFYQRRKQQECDFSGDLAAVEICMEQIRDIVNASAMEERQKLKERFSRNSDHLHRRPTSLSLFRDGNRFSSNSGIGNIWVMPKPEIGEDALSNRTTWYAAS